MNSPRLLLVDDEAHLTLIVGRVARMAGIEFAGRNDGPSAQAFMQQHAPDLVLLDLNLPGMSGVELLRRLRAASSTASVKVALFCQSGLSADVAAGWAAGADFLVWKDLIANPVELRRRLAAILQEARGQSARQSLTCLTNVSGTTSQDWATPVERILSLSPARELGGEVLEQVLRRALAEAWPGADVAGWVVVGQGRLEPRSLPKAAERHGVWVCLASLTDQLGCLLGAEASEPLAEALRDASARL